MLKNFSIKALSILLTTCISSSMFAVSATALNNEKTSTEIIPVQESIKKTISSESVLLQAKYRISLKITSEEYG